MFPLLGLHARGYQVSGLKTTRKATKKSGPTVIISMKSAHRPICICTSKRGHSRELAMFPVPSLAARHAPTTTHASTVGRPLATKATASFLRFVPVPVLAFLPMLVEADKTRRRSRAPDVPQSRLAVTHRKRASGYEKQPICAVAARRERSVP